MASYPVQIGRIIKKLDSIQEKKNALALAENALFWEESEQWYKIKKAFFKQKNTESWASFLRKLKVPLFTVEYRVALYKKWIKDLGYTPKELAGIHTKKLHRAIPCVGTKKASARILIKARELPYQEFLSWLKKHCKL